MKEQVKQQVKQQIVLIVFALIFLCQMIYYAGIENPPYESLKSGDAATYVFPGQYKQIVLPRVPIYSYITAWKRMAMGRGSAITILLLIFVGLFIAIYFKVFGMSEKESNL